MKNLIRLKWWRDPKGYEIGVGDDGEKYICPLSKPPKLNKETGEYSNVSWYDIDGGKHNIAIELFNRVKHAEGALAFTQEYGLLNSLPKDSNDLSPTVSSVVEFAIFMRHRSSELGRHYQFNDQHPYIKKAGNYRVSLNIPAGSQEARLLFKPVKLIDLILLEVYLILAGGGYIRSCLNCDKYYPVGPGTGNYANKLTCDDRCRKAFSRLEKRAPD